MSDNKKKLKGLKSVWNEGASRKEGFVELPKGYYIGQVTKAYVKESAKGEMFVVFHWVVQTGEFEGSTTSDWNRIENSAGVYYTTEKLRTLGADVPSNPEDLEECLADLEDEAPLAHFEVIDSKSGDRIFKNVKVRRLAEEDDEADGYEEEEAEVEAEEEEVEEAEVEEEEEAEEEEEDGIELEIGMHVEVEGKGEGKVVKIDAENGLVHVKLDTGKKAVCSPDTVFLVPEKPKAKTKAKKSKKATRKTA